MLGEIFEGSEGDATSHMSSHMTGRISVIARVSGRRHWTLEQKLGMLRDAFGSGGGVRTAIERHEVSSGQLYTWRRQAQIQMGSGELTGFAPPMLASSPTDARGDLAADFAEVVIAAPELPALMPPPPIAADPVGRIGIELASGIRLTVDTGVDAEALARVLSVIGR